MTALIWIGVAALGGTGAVARFLLDGAVQRRVQTDFPVGTAAVNLLGSAALGAIVGLGVGGSALLLAGTAALGSFTTFSTWMLETERLAEDGDDGLGIANVGVLLVIGFLAALAGWAAGRAL